MSIHFVDGLRSILIWQSIVQAVTVSIAVGLLLGTENPRPGRFVGVCATGLSMEAFIVFVVSETLDDFGKTFDVQLALSLTGVYIGSLGFNLLILHLIFHSERVYKFLSRLFKLNHV